MISFSDEMDTEVEVVQSVGDTFIRVLTQCRHRVRPKIPVELSLFILKDNFKPTVFA